MKKYDAAESYLKEMLNINENIGSMSIYDIKNVGLFGIISTKVNYAKNHGIEFDLKVFDVVDSIPNVKISDLCEVIGIYLDNALEEVLNNGKLKVEMHIETTDKNIILKIANECIDIPNLKKSKKGADRGNGLLIANKILSSYKNISHSTSFDKERMLFSQILSIAKEA
jgi:two-component system sensor histidine kinase AgrC